MSAGFPGSAYCITKFDAKGEVIWTTAIFRDGPRTNYTCGDKNALKGVNFEGCRFADLNFGAVPCVGEKQAENEPAGSEELGGKGKVEGGPRMDTVGSRKEKAVMNDRTPNSG